MKFELLLRILRRRISKSKSMMKRKALNSKIGSSRLLPKTQKTVKKM
jgi:hypothetical protein